MWFYPENHAFNRTSYSNDQLVRGNPPSHGQTVEERHLTVTCEEVGYNIEKNIAFAACSWGNESLLAEANRIEVSDEKTR